MNCIERGDCRPTGLRRWSGSLKILSAWIAIAATCTIVAISSGQNGVAYFFGGLLVWPIALALLVKKLRTYREQRLVRAQPDGFVAGFPFWFVCEGRVRLVDAWIHGTMTRFGSLETFRAFVASMSPEAEVSGTIPPPPAHIMSDAPSQPAISRST